MQGASFTFMFFFKLFCSFKNMVRMLCQVWFSLALDKGISGQFMRVDLYLANQIAEKSLGK
jgi:hypothetical protein